MQVLGTRFLILFLSSWYLEARRHPAPWFPIARVSCPRLRVHMSRCRTLLQMLGLS